MLSSGVQQAPSVACGGGGTVYEKRPRPASTSNDIHAGCLHWAFVLIEQSFSLCRSGWLAIRSGGYADLALALSAVPLCHPLSLTARGPAFGDERATVVHQLCGRDASGDRSLGTWMLKSRFTAGRAKLLQPRTLPHQSGNVTDTLSQPSRTSAWSTRS